MHKPDLYNMYLGLWQFAGNLIRRKECVCDAKESTTRLLSEKELQKALDFYKPYAKINPVFHAFYTEKTGVFDERYLPDDLYYTKIDTFYNNWNAAKVIDNKCYYENIFSFVKDARHPDTFLRRINGFWLDSNWELININQVVENLEEAKIFFLKVATYSEGGKGVYYFDLEKENTKEEFFGIVNGCKHDLVIQKPIIQCETLAQINRSSVNTIRILSLLRGNKVTVYSSILRMGVNGAKVDNASSGGITCGIDENGCLKDVAYSVKGDTFTVHPNSGIHFSGICIPGYDKAVALVKRCHPILPEFRLISWDIAIDDNEDPVLIEVNLKYGELDFHQLNNGPLFKEDTAAILSEVFRKN